MTTHVVSYLRASAIGTFIGAIPGVGGVTSSFLAYNVARNLSKTPDKFGTGKPEGVIATEAANSATCGGAMIPMMALGIPGDPIVAALMGGLLIHGLTPGTQLFLYNPETVAGIFIAFIIGAFLIMPIGFIGIPVFVRVLRIPHSLLTTGVLLLSIVGTYALQSQMVDLWVMWFFGIVGYLMRKTGFPLAPLVIGMVLGPIVESNFRRTLILVQDSVWGFLLGRPIALGILGVSVLFFLWPFLISYLRRRRRYNQP
jgi:putative tricarboxylic transport membrane protein